MYVLERVFHNESELDEVLIISPIWWGAKEEWWGAGRNIPQLIYENLVCVGPRKHSIIANGWKLGVFFGLNFDDIKTWELSFNFKW